MTTEPAIELTLGHPKWDQALPVLQSLRPHLDRPNLDQLLREGAPQGLRFTGLFDGDTCLAVAAWRVMVSTTSLRRFYIDAIAAAPDARNRGHGGELFRLLVERARQLRCETVELTAAVDRFDSHRFFIQQRMQISGHQFHLVLDED